MSTCTPDLLPELALGALSPSDAARAETHLTQCASCSGELVAIREAFGEIAAELKPAEPPTAVRSRLMRSVAKGRFAQFADKFSGLFDVAVDRGRQLLDLIDDATSWEAGPVDGSALVHFQAGPATAGADTGFVRVAPGVLFPWHSHGGRETNLVLQGSCVDSDGTVYKRGDLFVNEPGSAHEFRATEGDIEYIFAVVVFDVDFEAPKPSHAPSA